jgi:hypothetical protein
MTQLYHVIVDGWPMTSEEGTTHLALFYWAIERHGSGGDTNSDFRPQNLFADWPAPSVFLITNGRCR